ncbi:hypothetical protein HNQ88_002971 [Aureibacter tunicatorum]|uniref:Uncharacterized protein n=1 Tax=Aureibacter tunicatorum TaxID=866807 RepID=A0AAE4BTL0_9BACT|nr:hypothetical protein [Aureibacter tunicatorum]BDD04398.1 hypothetical protein AUTU_18810 [Aureibacter tunicatorum]
MSGDNYGCVTFFYGHKKRVNLRDYPYQPLKGL